MITILRLAIITTMLLFLVTACYSQSDTTIIVDSVRLKSYGVTGEVKPAGANSHTDSTRKITSYQPKKVAPFAPVPTRNTGAFYMEGSGSIFIGVSFNIEYLFTENVGVRFGYAPVGESRYETVHNFIFAAPILFPVSSGVALFVEPGILWRTPFFSGSGDFFRNEELTGLVGFGIRNISYDGFDVYVAFSPSIKIYSNMFVIPWPIGIRLGITR